MLVEITKNKKQKCQNLMNIMKYSLKYIRFVLQYVYNLTRKYKT